MSSSATGCLMALRLCLPSTAADPAAGRGADPRDGSRHSDRRRQGLLRRCRRLHTRAAAAGALRAHQFQPHGDS
jgi:hypothetical protein